MKVKCIIHKNQNDELQHDAKFELMHPRDEGGKFTNKWITDFAAEEDEKRKEARFKKISEENKRMAAELANRKMKAQLYPEPENLSASAAKATGDIFKGIQTISNEASKLPTEKGKTEYGRYPDMTEAELQKTINRLQLENRYSDLVGDTKYTKSGSEKTREIMQSIGAVAGILGSIATSVAIIIPLVKKGRGASKGTAKVAKVAAELVVK